MKYYNVEVDVNQSEYMCSRYNLCSCENKPYVNTHILSVVCKRDCSNFIAGCEDDKDSWVDCKYYTNKVRKEKLKQLNNEIL